MKPTIQLIRAFYRRFNTTASSKSKARSRQSLIHLLRILIKDNKKLEWLDEFKDKNLLWRPSAGLVKLDSLSYEKKLALIEEVSAPAPVRDKPKKQRQRRQYKAKIKEAIVSERYRGNELAADLLEVLLMTPKDERVEEWILETFKSLEMSRKNQRVKMVETYIDAHNSLFNSVPNENNIFLQEGLFKIPHQWNITTDIISTESYITVVRDFLTEYFPDYPIELIAAHHDERMRDTKTGLFTDTGAHSHYILSGRNSRTGVFDLNKAQVKVVNDYIKQVGDKDDYLPDDGKMENKHTKIFGHYFQHLFYDYFNHHLLEPAGLRAEFADETERQSKVRKQMNKESKLAKELRAYNLFNAMTEKACEQQLVVMAENTELSQKKNVLQEDISVSQQQLRQENKQLEQVKILLLDYSNELKSKGQSLLDKEAEIEQLKRVTEQLGTVYGQHLSTLIKDIYVRIECRNLGLDKKAEQYLQQIVERFKSHIPEELQALCISAVQAVGDNDLESQLLESSEVNYE